MPTSAATAAGDRLVVAGEQHRGQARARAAAATASAEVGLTVSATTSTPRASPSQPTATAVLPSRLGRGASTSLEVGRQVLRPVGEQPRPRPTTHRVPVDDALHAEALDVGEALDGGQRADRSRGAVGDRLGDRVLGGVLQRAGQPQHLVARRSPSAAMHVDQRHPARW